MTCDILGLGSSLFADSSSATRLLCRRQNQYNAQNTREPKMLQTRPSVMERPVLDDGLELVDVGV